MEDLITLLLSCLFFLARLFLGQFGNFVRLPRKDLLILAIAVAVSSVFILNVKSSRWDIGFCLLFIVSPFQFTFILFTRFALDYFGSRVETRFLAYAACQNPFAPLSPVNVVEETFCIAGPDFLRRVNRRRRRKESLTFLLI